MGDLEQKCSLWPHLWKYGFRANESVRHEQTPSYAERIGGRSARKRREKFYSEVYRAWYEVNLSPVLVKTVRDGSVAELETISNLRLPIFPLSYYSFIFTLEEMEGSERKLVPYAVLPSEDPRDPVTQSPLRTAISQINHIKEPVLRQELIKLGTHLPEVWSRGLALIDLTLSNVSANIADGSDLKLFDARCARLGDVIDEYTLKYDFPKPESGQLRTASHERNTYAAFLITERLATLHGCLYQKIGETRIYQQVKEAREALETNPHAASMEDLVYTLQTPDREADIKRKRELDRLAAEKKKRESRRKLLKYGLAGASVLLVGERVTKYVRAWYQRDDLLDAFRNPDGSFNSSTEAQHKAGKIWLNLLANHAENGRFSTDNVIVWYDANNKPQKTDASYSYSGELTDYLTGAALLNPRIKEAALEQAYRQLQAMDSGFVKKSDKNLVTKGFKAASLLSGDTRFLKAMILAGEEINSRKFVLDGVTYIPIVRSSDSPENAPTIFGSDAAVVIDTLLSAYDASKLLAKTNETYLQNAYDYCKSLKLLVKDGVAYASYVIDDGKPGLSVNTLRSLSHSKVAYAMQIMGTITHDQDLLQTARILTDSSLRLAAQYPDGFLLPHLWRKPRINPEKPTPDSISTTYTVYTSRLQERQTEHYAPLLKGLVRGVDFEGERYNGIQTPTVRGLLDFRVEEEKNYFLGGACLSTQEDKCKLATPIESRIFLSTLVV